MSIIKRLKLTLEPLYARLDPAWDETNHPSDKYSSQIDRWRDYPFEPERHEDHEAVKTAASYGPFRVKHCKDCVEHYRVFDDE